MVRQAQRATRNTQEHKSTCIICKKVTPNDPNICAFCFKRIKVIVSNESDPIDRALTGILRCSRAVDRVKLVRSLGKQVCGPSQDSAARLETLQKELNAKKDKIRYLERSKPIQKATKPSPQKAKFAQARRAQIRQQLEKDKERQDRQALRKLLGQKQTIAQLDNVEEIVHKTCRLQNSFPKYRAHSKPFCDGYKIFIGKIKISNLTKSTSDLKNRIQDFLTDLSVKNLMFLQQGDCALLWVTFTYESAELNTRTLVELKSIVTAVKGHSKECWAFDNDQEDSIKATKIDLTVDLSGSFLTTKDSKASETLQMLIDSQINQIFQQSESNFLDLSPIYGLRTVKGSNNLNSCLQYVVTIKNGKQLLNVKVYDKLLDLIGREHIYTVSSRLNTVLCSGHQPGAFERMIHKNRFCGVTRLEISILPDAIEQFNPWYSSVRTLWHKKVGKALEILVNSALNNTKLLSLAYKEISLPRLINCLCNTEVNILAVGKRLSWLINAETGHKNHFVGTQVVAGVSHTAQDSQQFGRLRGLVLRYAGLQSQIQVYWLHQNSEDIKTVAKVKKKKGALVQAPCCSKEPQNGILLADWIKIPISADDLDGKWLQNWDMAVQRLTYEARADNKKDKDRDSRETK